MPLALLAGAAPLVLLAVVSGGGRLELARGQSTPLARSSTICSAERLAA